MPLRRRPGPRRRRRRRCRSRRTGRSRSSGSSPRHIICVSSVPDAPTSVPAMISRSLSSTKPVAAAARPVNELSRRDHDGHVGAADRQHHRSRPAPATARRPPAAAPRARSPVASSTASASTASASAAFTSFCAGQRDRAPGQQLLQLGERHQRAREADRADDGREQGGDDRPWPPGRPAGRSASWYSLIAISAAAPPPTPLNSATICGIAVISHRPRRVAADGRADDDAGHDPAQIVASPSRPA